MTPEQLLARKRHIGASEAAAACGLSPWTTPFELWADKTSDDVEAIDSPAMEWGRRLEAAVLRKYADDQNVEPEYPCDTVVSSEYPWMACTPDALLDDRVIEIKTAGIGKSSEWGEPGSDDVPMQYLLQVMHQMIVTGKRLADIPVLIGGSDYRLYSVSYDYTLADLLIEREREFWACVENGTPPEVQTLADAAARWPQDTGEIVHATPELLDAVVRLRELQQEIKQREADFDALQLAVKTSMAEASVLDDAAGNILATWKAQKSNRFDSKAFRADHPDLYAEYKKPHNTRAFRLTRSKQ